MEILKQLQEISPMLLPALILVGVWEFIWKIIAMWKAGRSNHLAWYICLAFINTAGILPIIYILLHRKKE